MPVPPLAAVPPQTNCTPMTLRSHLLPIFVLLTLLGSAPSRAARSEDTKPDVHPLVGKTVNVELRSGRTLKGMIVEDVIGGDIPRTISQLRLREPKSGSRPILGAAAVKRVTSPDGKVLLVFEEQSKCLAPPDEKILADVRQATKAEKERAAARKSASNRKTKAHQSHKSSAGDDEDARRKRYEEKRKEFHDKTGVWLWPELTDEQQKEALKQVKDYVAKVQQRFAPLNMHLSETRYYLFLSDLPPEVASLYTTCLDEMHEELCKAFAIKDKDRVWLGGKVPVVAFIHGEDFAQFEKEFFHNSVPPAAQGLAHQGTNGVVVISCHCGKDPYYFAGVIVHEATHGFVHRYKSPEFIPNWLNEGIAEWVSMTVVKKNLGTRRKVEMAIKQLRKPGPSVPISSPPRTSPPINTAWPRQWSTS